MGVGVSLTASPQVNLSGCELDIPATGFGVYTPVAGPTTSPTRYTRMVDCTISAATFDLSKIGIAQGMCI